MNPDRRTFLSAALLLPGAVSAATEGRLVYAGTYTGPKSQGIYMWRFDADGNSTEPELAAETTNPSFLAIHPKRPWLYAVSETKGGTVTAFTMDSKSGRLTELNSQSSGGAGPCYVTLDNTASNVLVANYGGGSVAVLPIDAKDGRLREQSALVEHQGSSVHPKRQTKAYAHCVKLSPDNRFALVADLGMDQLLVYRFDPSAGTLKLVREGKLRPGTGPRHFDFHPNKRMVYVIGELNSTVTSFAWDNGDLYERQVVTTLPEGFSGESTTAEIIVHANGKFLYGSNRGHDSIAVFSVADDGKLTPRGHTPTGGQTPRNFVLDPSGRFLLAANQRSDDVTVFRINPVDGSLTATGGRIAVPSPVCLRFQKP